MQMARAGGSPARVATPVTMIAGAGVVIASAYVDDVVRVACHLSFASAHLAV